MNAQNTLTKIRVRAKALQRKNKNLKWIPAIKKASVELRKEGKIAVQTGTSKTSVDKKKKAKAPGKRTSNTGKVYYERRKNRSDKPGTLTGVKNGVKKLNGVGEKGYFTSISEAMKHIAKNKNKGKEFIINDSLHYGVGKNVYAYKSDLKKFNSKFFPSSNKVFGYLETQEEIKKFLKKLQKEDGGLYY